MAFDRLSPLDASFLHVEDAVTHMHIGSVSIFEGPPPSYPDLRDMVASKLPQVRRYRQTVKHVPLDLGRPVWVDDASFDVDYHVRLTALPKPGGVDELRTSVGRIMAQQLDRSRPLWEMWMVEGFQGNAWAVISKVHHCMADGVAGADLLGLILDVAPEVSWEPPPEWVPELAPAGWELALEALTNMASSPLELRRLARARVRPARQALGQVGDVVNGLLTTMETLRSNGSVAAGHTLNGPITPHRRWVETSLPVSDVKAIRRTLGGSFNDVVLAAITRGFRDLLEKRGESTESSLRTVVPVSVRARDDSGRAVGDGSLANRVSAVFTELPVHIACPVERLKRISTQMSELKDSNQAMAAEAIVGLAGFAPPVLLSLACRVGTKVSQRTVNTITTNVPGPQIPLYAAGRRMLKAYPYVPLGIQMRVGVAIFSYDGDLGFGITGDYDSAGDIAVLAEGIRAGMNELLIVGAEAADAGAVIVDLRSPGDPSDPKPAASKTGARQKTKTGPRS